MAEPVGKGFIELSPDVEGLKKSVGGLGGKLGGAFDKLGEMAGGSLSGGIGGAVSKLTSAMPGGPLGAVAAGVGVGVVAIGASLYKLGGEFNKAYNTIKVGTGATGEALEGLQTSFKNVAKGTAASFDDISVAIADVNTRTGATGAGLENLSDSMLKMSKLTGSDLASTIESTTHLFEQWQIPVEEMPGAMDKLFIASQETGIGVNELAEAARKSGSNMRQFGLSFDDSIAILATFDKAGLDSAAVSTALGKAIASQDSAVKKAQKEVEKSAKDYEKVQASLAGKTKLSAEEQKKLAEAYDRTVDAQNSLETAMGPLPDMLEDQIMAMKGAETQADANAIAIGVFGAKAGPQLAEALRNGLISIDDLKASLADSEGAIDQNVKATETFGDKMGRFKNQMKVALEPIAMGLFDAISGALEFVTPALTKFTEVIGAVVGWVMKCKPLMIAFGVAIGAVAAVFITMTVATKIYNLALAAYTAIQHAAGVAATVFKFAMIAVNAVMALNPFVLVAIAVGVLVAAIVLLYTKCDWFRDAIGAVWDGLVAGATAVKDAFVTAFNFVIEAIAKVIDWVKENWPLLVKIIIAILVPGGPIIAAFVHFREDIFDIVGKVIDWFKELPGKVVDALSSFGAKLNDWITDAWSFLVSGLGGSASDFVDWFKALPGKVLAGLGDLGGDLLGWVKSGFDFVVGKISGAAGGVLDFFGNLPGQVLGKLGDLGSGLAGAAGSAITGVAGDAAAASKQFLNYFRGLPDDVIKLLKPLGGKLTGWITDAFKSLVSVLDRTAKGFFDWFRAVPKKVVNSLGNVGKEVSKWVSDLVNSLISGLTGKAGGLVDAVKDIPAKILGALGGLGGDMTELGKKAIGSMSNGMRAALGWVADVAREIPGRITGAVGDATKWLVQKGKDVLGGLIEGWKNMWETLKALARNTSGVIIGAIGDATKWLVNKGKDIVGGLVAGWKNMWETLKAVARSTAGVVIGAVGNAIGWLKGKGQDAIRGVWEGMKSMKGWLAGTIKIGPWVWNSIGNAKDWLVEAGKNVIRGLWDGINAMRGWIMGKMRGLLDGLKKLLPFSPPKDPTSPFAGRGQPVYSGLSIGRQLAEGMERATPLVSAAAHGMLEAADLRPKLYDLSVVGGTMAAELAGAGIGGAQAAGGDTYQLVMNVSEADTSQLQAGFRRLELLSGAA